MTRFILLILLISFASVAAQAFQSESILTLPKVEDVKTIETKDNEYHYRYYTPELLLRILPHLIAGTVKPKDNPKFQYGAITLKDGTILKWRSTWENNLIIYNDNAEKVYVVDEHYSYYDGDDYFWLKLFSIFIFGGWIIAIASFYDYRHKNPTSRLTRFYNILFVRLLLRLLLASFAFYLAYLMFQEPLQAINDQVIRGSFIPKGGKSISYVYFADTNPGMFRLEIVSESFPSIISLICGLFILIARPRITYWMAKYNKKRHLPKNENETLIGKWQ